MVQRGQFTKYNQAAGLKGAACIIILVSGGPVISLTAVNSAVCGVSQSDKAVSFQYFDTAFQRKQTTELYEINARFLPRLHFRKR